MRNMRGATKAHIACAKFPLTGIFEEHLLGSVGAALLLFLPLLAPAAANTYVGIGMNSPGSSLVVQGNTADNTTSALNVTNSVPDSLLYVRNDGNVGLGTASPVQLLSLNKPAGTVDAVVEFGIAGAPKGYVGAAAQANNLVIGSAVGDIGLRAEGTQNLLFGTNSGVERMRITSAGNIGIGTPSPTVALDVAGGVRSGSSATVTACGLGQSNGEGTQRYNYTTHEMEYCNGTAWVSAASSGAITDVCLRGNGGAQCDCSLCTGSGWKLVGCWDVDAGGASGVGALGEGASANGSFNSILCVK